MSAREPEELLSTIALSQNYPNPFTKETNEEIAAPAAQTITATVYNIPGQRVASRQIPVSAGYQVMMSGER